MDIQIGRLYMNRTLMYLVPALKFYGSTFATKLNAVHKFAFGIHDTVLDGTPYESQKLIYVLIDTLVHSDKVRSLLDWIKLQEYYVMDYPYDDLENGRKHMLVVAFPHELGDVYDKFIDGKYSKMYCFDEIEKYFPDDSAEAKGVIIKSVRTKALFLQKVYNAYAVRLEPTDLVGSGIEYDFPPKQEEEFFNYKGE